MGRSVSYPTCAAWVLYTRLEYNDRQVYVCRKCDHEHYELEFEPEECTECGNVGFSLRPEYDDELAWEYFIDDLTLAFKKAFPSLKECDQWLNEEDHVILENGHVWIGVSEYEGMVSVWCVPKGYNNIWYIKGYSKMCKLDSYSEDGLHAQWAKSVEAKAIRVFESFAERLVPATINHYIFARAKMESSAPVAPSL